MKRRPQRSKVMPPNVDGQGVCVFWPLSMMYFLHFVVDNHRRHRRFRYLKEDFRFRLQLLHHMWLLSKLTLLMRRPVLEFSFYFSDS